MDEDMPICPGCGARAQQHEGWIETAHERDCPWANDPDSEPYD